MNYKSSTQNILRKLGIQKLYKGCEYIASSIAFISENEKYFSPVTKVLYVEIAKQHNTSNLCVEKNMRSVIQAIWNQSENKELLARIFGEYNLDKRPSNMEFLVLLYNYLKFHEDELSSDADYTFICPLSGTSCEFCKEFIIEKLSGLK